MADVKISALPTDTAPEAADLFPFVDTSATRTEAVALSDLAASAPFTSRYQPLGGSTPARDVPFSLDAGTTRHGVFPGVTFNLAAVASSTLGAASSTGINYLPFFVSESITIDALQLNVWTSGAGANFRLGLYNADTYWFPTSLVVDAGASSAASTGVKTLSFANTVLTAGRYYIAIQPDGVASFTPLTMPGNLMGGWGFGQDAQQFPVKLKTGNTAYAALASTAYTTSLAKSLASNPGFEYYAWMRSV